MRFFAKRYRMVNPKRFLFMVFLLIVLSLSGSLLLANHLFGHDQPVAESYGSSPNQKNYIQSATIEKHQSLTPQASVPAGTKIDEYKGIVVYSNGSNYMSNHGLNYSEDGYYYGYEWQCVEFVKRFYYEIYDHEMPDGAGNAKYFFNPMLEQGEINTQRGLVQYYNGGNMKPQPDDLLVFNTGSYGHVAIISEVGENWIEVIQQNSELPREKYSLSYSDGAYTIKGEEKPAGWLRIAK